MDLVQQLIDQQAIQSLTRELALQSQLVARDDTAWLLRIERESLQAGQTRDKLQLALAQAGHPVSLSLEMGRVTDSPAMRQAAAAAVPRGAVLRAGPAGHRHLSRLRPYHQRYWCSTNRLVWYRHAVLRHTKGTLGLTE